jgi:peptidoglycan hydrolase CwlO-like protein
MADDSVLKVVELFVDNINEANKNVTKDLDKINDSIDDLDTKMSTPPRHQELEADHKDLDEKVALVITSLNSIEDTIKNGIRTIKMLLECLVYLFL